MCRLLFLSINLRTTVEHTAKNNVCDVLHFRFGHELVNRILHISAGIQHCVDQLRPLFNYLPTSLPTRYLISGSPTPWWKRIDRRILIVTYEDILKCLRPFDSSANSDCVQIVCIQNLIPKRGFGFLDIFHSCVDYIYYNTFTGWFR